MKILQPSVYIQGPGGIAYIRMFLELGFRKAVDLDDADIICYTGGADVHPSMYGQHVNPNAGVYASRERDVADQKVWDSVERNIPLDMQPMIVGICRGGQFVNVMNGGKLYQDVDNHTRYHFAKDVKSGDSVFVSSTHHQQFIPGNRAEIVCVATESTRRLTDKDILRQGSDIYHNDYEVLWYPDTKSLCFQPHPEYDDALETRAYFAELLRRYGGFKCAA